MNVRQSVNELHNKRLVQRFLQNWKEQATAINNDEENNKLRTSQNYDSKRSLTLQNTSRVSGMQGMTRQQQQQHQDNNGVLVKDTSNFSSNLLEPEDSTVADGLAKLTSNKIVKHAAELKTVTTHQLQHSSSLERTEQKEEQIYAAVRKSQNVTDASESRNETVTTNMNVTALHHQQPSQAGRLSSKPISRQSETGSNKLYLLPVSEYEEVFPNSDAPAIPPRPDNLVNLSEQNDKPSEQNVNIVRLNSNSSLKDSNSMTPSSKLQTTHKVSFNGSASIISSFEGANHRSETTNAVVDDSEEARLQRTTIAIDTGEYATIKTKSMRMNSTHVTPQKGDGEEMTGKQNYLLSNHEENLDRKLIDTQHHQQPHLEVGAATEAEVPKAVYLNRAEGVSAQISDEALQDIEDGYDVALVPKKQDFKPCRLITRDSTNGYSEVVLERNSLAKSVHPRSMNEMHKLDSSLNYEEIILQSKNHVDNELANQIIFENNPCYEPFVVGDYVQEEKNKLVRTTEERKHTNAKLFDIGFIVHYEKCQDQPKFIAKYPSGVAVHEFLDFCFPDAASSDDQQWHTGMFTFITFNEINANSPQYGHCYRILEGRDKLTVICVVSSYPDENLFYDMLIKFDELRLISAGKANQFMEALSSTEMPAATDSSQTSIVVNDTTFVLPKWERQFPKLESFAHLQRHFVGDSLTKIFAAMLREKQLVFICSDLYVLCNSIRCLGVLLYPYHWQYTILPILPINKLSLCNKDRPFIVGFLKNNPNEIPYNDFAKAIVFDIDSNTFVKNPDESVTSLLSNKLLVSLAKAEKSARNEKDTEQQSLKLFEAYLQFFSTLSGHYLNYFEGTGSGKSFRVELFLKKASSKFAKQILDWFVDTQMFKEFIKKRLESVESKDIFLTTIEEVRKECSKLSQDGNAGKKFMRIRQFLKGK